MSTPTKGQTWLDLAREVFPDASDATLEGYLWTFTGFPGFFYGDPQAECRAQLLTARAAMVAGQDYDPEYGWHTPIDPRP
jgi:hypothetical protein